jgi:AraC-like DNA-binding protein
MDKRQQGSDHYVYRPPTYSVIWVLAGSGTYVDAVGRMQSFRAGDCFHRWPGRAHSTEVTGSEGWVEWFVDCGPGLHQAFSDADLIQHDPPVWRPRHQPLEVLEQLRTDLRQAHARQLPRLTTRVLELIALSREESQAGSTEDLIDEACQLLAEEALTRGDLRSWCASQGLAYETFRKQFHRRMGEPPGQYRIRRRMERACGMLLAQSGTIAAVAEALGYASAYEFSAQFRRYFKMTPTQYRRQQP